MIIHKSLNQVAFENTYYLENDDHLLVVDPGSNWEDIYQKIQKINKPVAAILLTHTHYDHIMSLDKVRAEFGHPPVYVSKEEAAWLYQPLDNLSGLDRHQDLPDVICQPAEEIVQLDQAYHIEGFHFYALATPGHSEGSLSYVFPDDHLVLSGDALFRETIGRADLPTGDFDTLIRSIKEQLLTLPSHYQVYPGHGRATSIHHEKLFNPFLQGGA